LAIDIRFHKEKFPMKLSTTGLLVASLLLTLSLASLGVAQTPAHSESALPRLVRFGGSVKDAKGVPLTGVVGVTFALYTEATGGAPLWLETQNVTADSNGRYTVLLGATKPEGLPVELFSSEQARWVGAQVAGEAEPPRVLLVSAPYALKASDADTIGGLPPSAFVLAAPAAATGESSSSSSATASANSDAAAPATSSNVTSTGGTANTIPLFTTATNIQNSILTQTATTAVNVGGQLNMPAIGTATAKKGFNSQPHDFVASVYSNASKAAVAETFQFQAEPANNNKSTASGTLNLLFASGSGTPAETGLSINNKGLIAFAAGQTFPGAGTITGVTTAAGSGLTGGGTSGTLGLSLITTCASGQSLVWSGSAWACKTPGGGGSVTSVGLSAPSSDFTVTGSPVTSSGTLGLNWAVPPTYSNIANAIVKRDGSGGFSANFVAANTINTANAFVGGRLGVGTTSPRGSLDVYGGALRVTGTDQNGTAFVSSSAGTAYFSNNFIANGIAVSPSGSVGIGTGSPQAELNLNAGGNANADSLLLGNNSSKGLQLRDNGTGVDLESIGVPLFVNLQTQQLVTIGNFTKPYAPLNVGYLNYEGEEVSADFSNDVTVEGDLYVNKDFFVFGTKNFRIDHPLDPTNKYLKHSVIESSEVLNQYSGNAVLDAKGEARVEFPAWFEAINIDFRYQLTAVGAPGPNLYVAEEVKDNAFKIAGGTPGTKVSWQVTARRNDPYMRAHPYVVEQDKPENERGYYTDPSLYGAPKERGISSRGQVTAGK
jgi:trimeric autotransporter adhesin